HDCIMVRSGSGSTEYKVVARPAPDGELPSDQVVPILRRQRLLMSVKGEPPLHPSNGRALPQCNLVTRQNDSLSLLRRLERRLELELPHQRERASFLSLSVLLALISYSTTST